MLTTEQVLLALSPFPTIIFYLQIFEEGCHDDGGNWLVSVYYDNWRHGTESANMKWEMKEDGDGGLDPCVTDDCGN